MIDCPGEKEICFVYSSFCFFIATVARQMAGTKGLYSLLTFASTLMHNPSPCHHEDNKSKGSASADVPG